MQPPLPQNRPQQRASLQADKLIKTIVEETELA